MENKVNNDTYFVTTVEGDVTKEGSNKLKLQIASSLAIAEVQLYYIKEKESKVKDQLGKAVEEIGDNNVAIAFDERLRDKIALIDMQVNFLTESLEVAQEKYRKVFQIAKKALNLPTENFEELVRGGQVILGGIDEPVKKLGSAEIVGSINDVTSDLRKSEKRYNESVEKIDSDFVFDKVDELAIAEAVQKAMQDDLEASTINGDNLEEVVGKVSDKASEIYDNNVTENDIASILDSDRKIVDDEMNEEKKAASIFDAVSDPFIPPVVSLKEQKLGQVTKVGSGLDLDINLDDYKKLIEEEEKRKMELDERSKLLDAELEQANQEKVFAQVDQDREKDAAETLSKTVESYKRLVAELGALRSENAEKEAKIRLGEQAVTDVRSEIEEIKKGTSGYIAQKNESLNDLRKLKESISEASYSSGNSMTTGRGHTK